MPKKHKGWHSRGYLPHLDQPGLIQFITFRLADSVPASLNEAWKREMQDEKAPLLIRRVAAHEDLGHAVCFLRDPRVARMVEEAFFHFDGDRYRLLAWCVMPNHAHVRIETRPGAPVPDVVRSWKSYTARHANRLLGRTGSLWMVDYFDRFIRDERHLGIAIRYIHDNPVKAGLVARAEDWEFSSACEEG